MQMRRFMQTVKLPEVDRNKSHNASGYLTWGGFGAHPFDASTIDCQYDKGGPRFEGLACGSVAIHIANPLGDSIAFVNEMADDDHFVKHALTAFGRAGPQLGQLAITAPGKHLRRLLLLAEGVLGDVCKADPAYSATSFRTHDGGAVSCVVEKGGIKRWVILVSGSRGGVYPCSRKIFATNLTVGGNKGCESTLLIELDNVIRGAGPQGGGLSLLAQPPAFPPRAFQPPAFEPRASEPPASEPPAFRPPAPEPPALLHHSEIPPQLCCSLFGSKPPWWIRPKPPCEMHPPRGTGLRRVALRLRPLRAMC